MIDMATLKAITAIGMIVLMVAGVIGAVVHRVKREMGFGFRFIQVLAIVEIIPGVILLAAIGVLQSEAAAALIGVSLGYVFGLKAKEE
jgi:hypothetical protein